MLSKIWRWLFGESDPKPDPHPEPTRKIKVVGDGEDAYRDRILNECLESKGMVTGDVESNGDLTLRYVDGTKKRIPKDQL